MLFFGTFIKRILVNTNNAPYFEGKNREEGEVFRLFVINLGQVRLVYWVLGIFAGKAAPPKELFLYTLPSEILQVCRR